MDYIGGVLESSTENSIIGKDLAGKILLWNEGVRRLCGYEPEGMVELASSFPDRHASGCANVQVTTNSRKASS